MGKGYRKIEDKEEKQALAIELRAEGHSVKEIADLIGVGKTTLRRWLDPAEDQKNRDHSKRWQEHYWNEAIADPMQTLPMKRQTIIKKIRDWCIGRAMELGVTDWTIAEAYEPLNQAVFEYVEANPTYMGFYGRQHQITTGWINSLKRESRLF